MTVVLLVVLMGVVYPLIFDLHSTRAITDDSITCSDSSNTSFTYDNWVRNASCMNASGNTPGYYADLSAGAIMCNSTYNGQTISCNYTYYPDAYITSSATARTVGSTMNVVFAILVLVSIVTVLYIKGKQ